MNVLLINKANVNAKCAKFGQTPLHIAFREGFYEVCKQLLNHDANLTIQDNEGNTPIHFAFRFRYQHENKFPPNFFIDLQNYKGYKDAMLIKNNKGLLPSQLLDSELKIAMENLAFAYNANSKNQNKFLVPPIMIVKHPLNSTKRINRIPRYSSTNTTQAGTSEGGSASPSINSEYIENKKRTLNSYAALKILGKGSFGEVFLVSENDTKKLYAMKVFQKQKVFSQNLVKYAHTEKNIMATMNHPFIVSLHAAFQTKRQLFLIMEYCPNGDLSHLLRKEIRFSEEKARIYIMEIILAIEHLHKKNVIFRYFL